MSQEYESLPSMISGLCKDQLNRFILRLPEMGYSSLEFIDDELDHIDPRDFIRSLTHIVVRKYNLHYDEENPDQIPNSSSGSVGKLDDYLSNNEGIDKIRDSFKQAEGFFNDAKAFVKSIEETLAENKPQDDDSDDVQQAYLRCTYAVSNMDSITEEAVVKGGDFFEGGIVGCIVFFMHELVECAAQLFIVTKERIDLLEYKVHAPLPPGKSQCNICVSRHSWGFDEVVCDRNGSRDHGSVLGFFLLILE
ncbi:hypothetical protein H4219_005615 [Mycoemilia scoparia]|uniref:Uncharacterized protein n=1 Tax=Mycoemilia scoparia TaxID=417184 RepID=A0A9W7ZTW3_9FUNG|nr:hypothetical protein H4219_005615 [Mycoemilia scoparia]